MLPYANFVLSIFFVKSILSIFFLLFAFISALSMLALMGKTKRKMNPLLLRMIHRWSGVVFLLLFLVISYLCLRYVAFVGDKLSTRAVFHGVMALSLFTILGVKLSIVKFYRQFLKFVPGMGLTVFSLAFEITLISAGFYFLTSWHPAVAKTQPPTIASSAEAQTGKALFENKCSFCHYTNRFDVKVGPGLKEILKRDKLPVSGKPATPENVRAQLINPYKNMPSFQSSLSEEDIKNLIAYLKTF